MKGLKSTVFDITGCNCTFELDNYYTNKDSYTKILESKIFFEAADFSNNKDYYAQIFEVKFTALFAGDYRFWANSDDASRIFFNGKVIFNYNYWVSKDKFFTGNSQGNTITGEQALKSLWLPLAKGSKHDFKSILLEGSGASHIGIGVEIKNSNEEIDPNKTSAGNIFPVEIRPVYTRQVIKLEFSKSSSVQILDKDGKEVFSFMAAESPEAIQAKLRLICEATLVAKVLLNSNKQIYVASDSAWNLNSFSHSSLIKFDELVSLGELKSKFSFTAVDPGSAFYGYALFICFDQLVEKIPDLLAYKFIENASVNLSTAVAFGQISVITQIFANSALFANALLNVNFNDYAFTGLKYAYENVLDSNYKTSGDFKIRVIREKVGFEGVKFSIMTLGVSVKNK